MRSPRRAARPHRAREAAARYPAAAEGPVVVDASIACIWFVREPDRWGAVRLLDSQAMLVAPDFMVIETANAWWKRLRRGDMTPVDVDEAVTTLLALGIEWVPAGPLARAAGRLAADLGQPVCDCIYLALARDRSAALATADERLRRGAERLGVRLWRG